MRLTRQQARAKLAQLQAKFDNDPLAKSFHMGRVGFRKQSKRYLQSINAGIDEAIYMGKLQAHINRLDAQEASKNKPKPMKEPKPVRAKVPRNTYVLGFFNYPGCIVVCNTAREEKGDFVKLAHVSHKGEIMRYFKTNLPADIVERIDQCAFETKEKHEQKLQDEKKVRQLHKEWLLTQGYTREQIIKTYGPF